MTHAPEPYRSTPIFDAETLPTALRRAHCTKPGVWGRLDVLKGSVRYVIEETGEEMVLNAGDFVIILPEQMHHVEPLGDMQMQVGFYNVDPEASAVVSKF